MRTKIADTGYSRILLHKSTEERGGVSIKLQQKVKVKGLLGYDLNRAREFLRQALIKALEIPNIRNETNKYFERYIDVVSENKTFKDKKGKLVHEHTAYVYMTEAKHIRTILGKLENELDPELEVDRQRVKYCGPFFHIRRSVVEN